MRVIAANMPISAIHPAYASDHSRYSPDFRYSPTGSTSSRSSRTSASVGGSTRRRFLGHEQIEARFCS